MKYRSPTYGLVDNSPHEVWFVKKPFVAHTIFFWCGAFLHVPKEKRNKLDNTAEKCVFISYKDGVKGYKLWNFVTRKIMYSRDVVFKEVESTSRNEDEFKEKGLDKMEFELKDEGFDSFEEESSEYEEV